MKSNTDMPLKMGRLIGFLADRVVHCGEDGMIHFDLGSYQSSFAMEFSTQEIETFGDLLSRELPYEAVPISVGHDEAGDIIVSLAGIRTKGIGIAAITQLIRDLCVISETIPHGAGGREVYTFGAAPFRRTRDVLLSTWARSPEEAIAKLLVSLTPGLSRKPYATIATDPFAAGPIEMRRGLEQQPLEMAPILRRARAHLGGQ